MVVVGLETLLDLVRLVVFPERCWVLVAYQHQADPLEEAHQPAFLLAIVPLALDSATFHQAEDLDHLDLVFPLAQVADLLLFADRNREEVVPLVPEVVVRAWDPILVVAVVLLALEAAFHHDLSEALACQIDLAAEDVLLVLVLDQNTDRALGVGDDLLAVAPVLSMRRVEDLLGLLVRLLFGNRHQLHSALHAQRSHLEAPPPARNHLPESSTRYVRRRT